MARPEKYAPRVPRYAIPLDAEPVDDTADRERQAADARRACAEHLADLMREYCPPRPRRVASDCTA